MTKDELVTACHEYVLAHQPAKSNESAAASTQSAAESTQEAWTGHLHITPDIVAEILDSNKEV